MSDSLSAIHHRLARVEAELEIMRLKSRYFNAGDRLDFATMRACFTDDARISFPSFGIKGGPDELCRIFAGHAAENPALNIHHGHNAEIEFLNETHAKGTWNLYFFAVVSGGTSVLHSAGFYHDEYQLTEAGWRISGCESDIRLTVSADVRDRVRIVAPIPTA